MLGKRFNSLSGFLGFLEGLVDFGLAFFLVIPRGHLSSEYFNSFFQAQTSVANAAIAGCFILAWISSFRPFTLTRSDVTEKCHKFIPAVKEFSLMAILLCAYLFVVKHSINLSTVLTVYLICIFFRLSRLALEHWLESRDPQFVIILGSGRRASKTWREIRTRFHSTVKLVGFVDDRPINEMPPDIANRYLGTIDQLDALLFANAVDKLVVALPLKSCYEKAQRAVTVAEQAGIQILSMHDSYTISGHRPAFLHDSMFTELVPVRERHHMNQAIKRCVDFVGALICLSLLFPVFLLIASMLKLNTNRSVFHAEDRLGLRRRVFRIYLFNLFGQKTPYIAVLARFLHKTSLDKLPLLLNVLVGNMSLVGPRPMSLREVSVLSKAALMRRFTVKPGLTGLWKLGDPGSAGFENSIESDFEYIDEWSLALDFHILVKTLSAVFTRTVPV
jgi:lipopolysaccharide/colanic/teichoic acid biosynthesis glycosyltransferase